MQIQGLRRRHRAELERAERELILAALERCDWYVSRTAADLGEHVTVLRRLITRYGITDDLERGIAERRRKSAK